MTEIAPESSHAGTGKREKERDCYCSFFNHLVMTTTSLRKTIVTQYGHWHRRGLRASKTEQRLKETCSSGTLSRLFWHKSSAPRPAPTMDLELTATRHGGSCFCYLAGASRWIGLQYLEPKAEWRTKITFGLWNRKKKKPNK